MQFLEKIAFFKVTNYKNPLSFWKAMKNLLWYLIAGTRGGETRGRIIELIKKTPSNANKISENLSLDYKTIRHHLEILEKNKILSPINKGNYGAVYFLTEEMKSNIRIFSEIWDRFGKK